MSRALLALLLPAILVIAACNGGNGDDGEVSPMPADPTPTATSPATEIPMATPTETPPADDAVCLEADDFQADGTYSLSTVSPEEALQVIDLRWAAHEGCERFVIDLALADGGEAAMPGEVSAEFLRDQGIVRIQLPGTEQLDPDAGESGMIEVDGPLAQRAFVVRDDDRSLYVDLHLGEAAEAAVSVLEDPARVVVDLRPGGDPLPPPAVFDHLTLVLQPRSGEASYPLTVTGYARNFEANVVARIEQDGDAGEEIVTTANDWTEAWGAYSLTIEVGPSDAVELHVGDYSAQDGTWQGAMVELEMPHGRIP